MRSFRGADAHSNELSKHDAIKELKRVELDKKLEGNSRKWEPPHGWIWHDERMPQEWGNALLEKKGNRTKGDIYKEISLPWCCS